jgi:hypothetical protein
MSKEDHDAICSLFNRQRDQGYTKFPPVYLGGEQMPYRECMHTIRVQEINYLFNLEVPPVELPCFQSCLNDLLIGCYNEYIEYLAELAEAQPASPAPTLRVPREDTQPAEPVNPAPSLRVPTVPALRVPMEDEPPVPPEAEDEPPLLPEAEPIMEPPETITENHNTTSVNPQLDTKVKTITHSDDLDNPTVQTKHVPASIDPCMLASPLAMPSNSMDSYYLQHFQLQTPTSP